MTIITPTGITGINSITSSGSTLVFQSASGTSPVVTGLDNISSAGIITATGFVGDITGNINATGVSTIATLNATQSNSTNLNVSGFTTATTLRATSIVGVTTAGITTAYIGSVNDGPISGARNRIINGDMRIDQRNAGASVTVNLSQVFYGVDRWISGGITSNGVFTIQQNTSAPSGFTNSTKVTVTTADSSISTSYTYNFQQRIEGFNTADLGYGTSSAKTITLSFWTRSSLTGTFGGSLQNGAQNYSYPFTYSISSVDTWEYKTITIPGPTSGTWSTDNSSGIIVMFSIGAGSGVKGTSGSWAATQYYSATGAIDLISTLNSTWYVTGVQLEAGTVATPFERRSFGQELALCQRYFCKSSNPEVVAINGAGYTTDGMFYSGTASLYGSASGYVQAIMFPVSMRTTPSTITFITTSLGGSTGQWSIYYPNVWTGGNMTVQGSTSTGFGAVCSGSWTAGVGLTYGAWTASAEL